MESKVVFDCDSDRSSVVLVERHMAEILESFEAAWRRGDRPVIDDWLGDTDNVQQRSDLKELLSIELSWRRKSGEDPQPDEYHRRFPEYSSEIDIVFASFDQATIPVSSSTSAPEHDTTASRMDVTTVPSTAPGQRHDAAEKTVISSGVQSSESKISDRLRCFGDYELLNEIARGGMGVVFKARQIRLNRIVALKMILAGGLADTEEIQRFQAEAEAAGNLDHPGIVPIYEIGEHDGQHYFSMGFVEGQSLGDRVKNSPLAPLEAAELTRKIATAVAYAHQHGVIHRDLKPSNVLLNAAGEPKVTDFGLAKRVEGNSGLTQTGAVMGTPGYMPPEQAAGRTDDVGPLADVYSLGAVLYCLLTGQPPFVGGSLHETLRQVIEDSPRLPSTIVPGTPRDLETICLNCLEKAPERRYQSADLLSEDLWRFLNHYPIIARRTGPAVRVWRWCQRNRVVAGLLLIVAMLMSVAVVSGIRMRTQQAEASVGAEQRLQAAQERLDDEIIQVEQQYSAGDNFLADYPELTKSTGSSLRKALDEFESALAEYRKFLPEQHTDGHRLHRAAVAQFHVAQAYRYLDQPQLAETSFRVAIDRLLALDQAFPLELRHRYRAGIAMDYLGELLRTTDNTVEAKSAYQQAMELQQDLVDRAPDIPDYRLELSRTHNNYGILLFNTDDRASARQHYEAASQILHKLVHDDSGNPDYLMDHARTLVNLGHLYQNDANPVDAVTAYEKAASALKQLINDHPKIPRYSFLLAICENNWGYTLGVKLNEKEQAENLLLQSSQRFADLPSLPLYRLRHVLCLNNLGVFYGLNGELAKAKSMLESARDLALQLVEKYPDTARYKSELGRVLGGLGAIAWESGEPDVAISYVENAIVYQSQAWTKNSQAYWRLLKDHHVYLASLLLTGDVVTVRQKDEAMRHIEKAVEVFVAPSLTPEISPFRALADAPYDVLHDRSDFSRCMQSLGKSNPLKQISKTPKP